jgi:exopolysaccharide biosynthesis protein
MKKVKIYLVFLFIPVAIFSQDFKTVHDGVEYAEVTKEISGLKVNMNLLLLDLAKVRLDVVHATDAAIGVEKTSSIASRHGALAAINAGFFRLDSSLYAGDAAGILKIDGKLLSEPDRNRVALFIGNKADRIGVTITHTGETLYLFKLKDGKNFRISGVNCERIAENAVILYTPEFHRTTLTDNDGMEIVVREGKVVEIRDGKGSSAIPEKGYVISVRGKVRELVRPLLKEGLEVSLDLIPTTQDEHILPAKPGGLVTSATYWWAEDIVGGVPQLIKDGKIDITWEKEGSSKAFVETRHPRTAVAKLKGGKFLMITVDGRSEISGGIGLQDLAEYLLSLGAADAMNLDGGGSTTMFLDGKVVNKPSDKEGERKVSDALLVTPRKR